MTQKKKAAVVGVFEERSKAQQAVQELTHAGFTEEQIGVIALNKDSTTSTKEEAGSHVGAGALTGIAAGAGVGALWALGIAANVLPGIGPVISGGIIASILASAAGGAAIAGIVGALVGLGIPEEEAHYYEGEFKAGRTLVTVKANGRNNEAWTILKRHGAYRRDSGRNHAQENSQENSTTAFGTRPAKSSTTAENQTIQLHEEQLRIKKKPVEAGEVRVRKEVVTEQKTLQVPVTREEVVVERRPASGKASTSDMVRGEEVRIPIAEERVRVEKDTVLKEEVHVRKRKVTDSAQVSGDVRKEEIKVEQEGDVKVRNVKHPGKRK